MIIRRAIDADIPGLAKLLDQVLMVHYEGRPDLFVPNTRKYSDKQLAEMLDDESRPIFVAVAEDAAPGEILGYAFCVDEYFPEIVNLTPIHTLYIDDLCVDEQTRGQRIGEALYNYVVAWAKERKYYRITLNVWTCNPSALGFYEHLGLQPFKMGMEQIL